MKSKTILRWFYFLPIAYALYYVNIVQSLSSLVIIPVLLLYVAVFNPPWKFGKTFGRIALGVFIFALTLLSWKLYSIYQIEFQEVSRPQNLEHRTINGNKYHHDLNDHSIENGNYVMMYVCDIEMEREWSKRSEVPYMAKVNGFPLRTSLMRFMTSKGLRKDSLNFQQLTQEEIAAIERGVANYRFVDGHGIASRIHVAMWELRRWRDGMQRHESSVSMRLFLWKSGWDLMKENLLFGIGTGDLQDAYRSIFVNSIHHESESIRRAHNQYLTVGISAGAIGLFAFLFWIGFVFRSYGGGEKFLFRAGLIVYCLGMLWEDSLESQAGIALAIVFFIYPLAEKAIEGGKSEAEKIALQDNHNTKQTYLCGHG